VPPGHDFTHVWAFKKFGEEQLVQAVSVPEQVVQGVEQTLHCLSDVSPNCPAGQVETHEIELKK
jgi:hypothetical protein